MRVIVRTSKLAIWARRFAFFAIAVLAVTVGLRFFGQIAYSVFEISLTIGATVAAIAFVCGTIAYIRLWFSGDRGWGQASAGFFLGLLGMTPVASALILTEIYPSTADVTTALSEPPDLLIAFPNRPGVDPETILVSYPNLITRIYQVPPDILFELGESLVEANGWAVLESAPPPAPDASGYLNAIRPGVMGGDNEIAFRVMPGPIGGAVIDLRAAAIEPVHHDLGDNGRAIESFLLALDDRVTGFIEDRLDMTDEETFEVIDEGNND